MLTALHPPPRPPQEIIAVNQDPLGVPGDLVWQQGTRKIFAGPLAGGARAVVLANFQTTQSQYPLSNLTVFWEQARRRRAGGARKPGVCLVFHSPHAPGTQLL